ncbi:MBL fold metallo-hydrolase [Rothia aerolata]|uniref:Metal-dependent hydrolase n=1 Tax=Rothia aerolata TaxID=1812262 RepID=A0A917IP70_9MICC|nr:MBL fold metallo-hydrolase [Rothia aerolata]GGH59053.1 metal-dependent hydrolase [Rothia aerolata]
MRLTVIGCSGSFPSSTSPASCYLLSATDPAGRVWRILVDMGNGALGNLQQHVKLSDIDAILISHLHPDHCIDLSGVHVAVKWDPRGWPKGPIPLYGPQDIHEYILHTQGLTMETGMHTEFDFHEWSHHEKVQIGPFTVEPFEVVHPVKDPYALRIECNSITGRTVLTYSGDTDSCQGLVDAARGADLFLCEAAYREGRDDHLRGIHLTGKRAAEAAKEAGARNLMLTHLPVWNDPDEIRAEAEAVFDGGIGLAETGATYLVHPRPVALEDTTYPATTTLKVIDKHL